MIKKSLILILVMIMIFSISGLVMAEGNGAEIDEEEGEIYLPGEEDDDDRPASDAADNPIRVAGM